MKSNPDPLEKEIQKKVRIYAKGIGVMSYKFSSPAQASVPDVLFINPGGLMWFVEFKRLGERPTPAQAVEISKLRKQGVRVFVIDNVQGGKDAVDGMLMMGEIA